MKHGHLSMCFLSLSRSLSMDYYHKISLDMIKFDYCRFEATMVKRSSKTASCFEVKFSFELFLTELLRQFARNFHVPP